MRDIAHTIELEEPSIIAWGKDGAVDFETFATSTSAMSEHLRARGLSGQRMAVLAQDRLPFMTALYGALLAGCDIILPGDDTQRTLQTLAGTHDDLWFLCDADSPYISMTGLRAMAIQTVDALQPPAPFDPAPRPPSSQRTVTVFTSGSTGAPEPQEKTWAALCSGAEIWAERLLLDAGPASIVATVPPQHMYGLEASVMLPLIRPDTSVMNARPFYPADIRDGLSMARGQRVLVTTPLHLATMLKSGLGMPSVHVVVSATAPLSREIAEQAEQHFAAPVIEVYGTSETGMIATRRTAREQAYHLRDDLTLTQKQGKSIISGHNFPEPKVIDDNLECRADRRIMFKGRGDDLVNVAGKRASLSGLSAILNSLSGIEDGVFLATSAEDARGVRLTAFVVAPHLDDQAIRQKLRTAVPDIFVPRRIVFLDVLPRNTTGKVSRQALLGLLADDRSELAV